MGNLHILIGLLLPSWGKLRNVVKQLNLLILLGFGCNTVITLRYYWSQSKPNKIDKFFFLLVKVIGCEEFVN